jgi:nicotinamide-nucleotide adenylyltransferase
MTKLHRGLIIGRFQPFHNGHSRLIGHILNECNEVIIAIGSSQFNYSFSNPFTAGERLQMVHDTLIEQEMDLKKIYIVPISNSENNAVWLSNLSSMVPKFDILYSGNRFVTELVSRNRGTSFRVVIPRLYRKNVYNGTKIRVGMTSDEKWIKCISVSTYNIIMENNGVQRMKLLLETEKSESGDKIREYPNVK